MIKIFSILLVIFCIPHVAYATNGVIVSPNRAAVKNQVQQILIKQKVVDFAQPFGVNTLLIPSSRLGLQYYYKVVTDEETEALADKIADKIILKLFPNGVVNTPPNDKPDVTPNKPVPQPPVEPTDIDSKVLVLFQSKCAKCHNGDNAKGNLKILENNKLVPLTIEQKWNIFDRVDGSGLSKEEIMPQGSDPLDQESVDLIRKWVRG